MSPNVEQNLEHAFNDSVFNSFGKGYYIGIMSGTSLDGLDAVICQFDNDKNNSGEDHDRKNNVIVATHSGEFPSQLRQVLLALCQPNASDKLSELTIDNIAGADYPQSELEWFGWASREYGAFASAVVNELLNHASIDAESILAIGCHGQTVRHRPNLGFSLQLVDPNIIAERTGISVVTDFRRRDMAVGGQGAPLAPAFHLAQFGTNDNVTQRIIVNLGGIANITVLPNQLLGQQTTTKVIGYDTGPANILLDAWYQYQIHKHDLLIQYPDFEPFYDKGGEWAKTGQVNKNLLDALLAHPYFNLPTPKSTGREDFNLAWLKGQIAHIKADDNITIEANDVQATLTAFTAQTLSQAIVAESKNPANNQSNRSLDIKQNEVVVCGGGAYNTYLLSQLADLLPNWRILTSENYGIAPTWVEAVAFAWLARQTIMGDTGNLPAVTGASHAVVLGQVCFA